MEVDYYGNLRPEMLSYVPTRAARVLDVGCGEGKFSAQIKARQGAEVWGIEMNPVAAAAAATRLDRVLVGDGQAHVEALDAERFDCIVFNDVLEHMTDPYAMVRRVRTLLRPGGIVVASIPNVRYFRVVLDLALRGRWDYADYGVLDRTHLRFFTRRSIESLFVDAGYQIERMAGINPPAHRLVPVVRPILTAINAHAFDAVFCMQFAVVASVHP